MGIGDDIMLTAKIERLARENPGKKIVTVVNGSARYSEVYENNPHVSRVVTENCIQVEIRPRPYAVGTFQDDQGRSYVQLKENYPKPGKIYLTSAEIARVQKQVPEKFVTIEPNTKTRMYANNRDWGWHKWQQLVDVNPGINWIQLGDNRHRSLNNVKRIITDNIRDAFAILSLSKFHIGTEGGLIHAATALEKKSIVIFGGLSAPWATGYESNINFYVEHPESPCGRRFDCDHCRWCMDQITVDQVNQKLQELKRTIYDNDNI